MSANYFLILEPKLATLLYKQGSFEHKPSEIINTGSKMPRFIFRSFI